MKILVVCSTLDLKYKLGCTPAWWQLLKALHEIGNEVVTIPFLGDPVESLWWRTYPNPCLWESKLYNAYLEYQKKRNRLAERNGNPNFLMNRYTEPYIKSKWELHLDRIFKTEKDIDALVFFNVPLNFIKGIPAKIHGEYGIPTAFYDGDMPTILPKYAVDRGFRFSYYVDTDLSEFTAFFSNSTGVIPDLIEMGARNVHPLYYAADPDLFKPIDTEKNIDISFFGYGSELREEWMGRMITSPSIRMTDVKFHVAGNGFSINLGNASYRGDLSFSAYREFCCRSKICLNITRWSHTKVYASSTARPFELAALGSCIVSQPYSGIDEWFEINKDLVVLDENDNINDVYHSLLSSEQNREKLGSKARERILQRHTYKHRAKTIVDVLKASLT